MLWILRSGIILEGLGAILLSAAVVYILGENRVESVYNRFTILLRRFLSWLLKTDIYKQMRLRKTTPEDSILILIRENWLTLLFWFVVSYVCLFILCFALVTLNTIAIIFAIPVACFSGYIIARHWQNRFLKVFMFIFFAAISPYFYGMLICSIMLHAAILSIISFFALLHSFLSNRTVQQAMIVIGVLFIVKGAVFQLYYTFQ